MAHRSRRLALACCLAVAIFGSFQLIALAQSGGPYNLSWHNIGPGGASSGGNFTLNAAVGQPDAATMSGGSYTLTGGFLPGGVVVFVPGQPGVFAGRGVDFRRGRGRAGSGRLYGGGGSGAGLDGCEDPGRLDDLADHLDGVRVLGSRAHSSVISGHDVTLPAHQTGPVYFSPGP